MVEFSFNLSNIFSKDINAVRSDLIPVGYSGDLNHSLIQQQVSYILDVMGEQSSKAQGLKQQITSGYKFRQTEGQTAYILVDRLRNNGKGSVIGLLKVGHKKLFLMDPEGKANEMIPNCVLDFYIAEDRQRSGCGKKLFEHMLTMENSHPRFMAIDRPSVKFLSFLRKHYGLANIIPQVNNYVIFGGFFKDRPLDCSPTPKKARIIMGKLQYV